MKVYNGTSQSWALFQNKDHLSEFPNMGIPIIKVRWSWDHLIFIIEIPILVRWHLCIEMAPWGWFNIKMPSYQYRNSHCRDKMVLWPSYLYNGIPYTGKITSLYWIRAWCLMYTGPEVGHQWACRDPITVPGHQWEQCCSQSYVFVFEDFSDFKQPCCW